MSTTAPKPTKAERKAQIRADRLQAEHQALVHTTRTRRWAQLAATAFGAIALVALFVVLAGPKPKPDTGTRDAATGLNGVAETSALFAGLPQQGTVLGNPNATRTLITYEDLQCPFCQQYTLNVLPSLMPDVKAGKLKIEIRLLRFLGPDSVRAARAAQAAAAQGKFATFVELWYRNQGEENSGYATDAFITKIADAAQLDPAPIVAAANSDSADEAALKANEAAATKAKIDSTPSFALVNPGSATEHNFSPSDLTPSAFASAMKGVQQ